MPFTITIVIDDRGPGEGTLRRLGVARLMAASTNGGGDLPSRGIEILNGDLQHLSL